MLPRVPFSEKIYLHRQGSSTYFAGEVYLTLPEKYIFSEKGVVLCHRTGKFCHGGRRARFTTYRLISEDAEVVMVSVTP